MLLGNGTESKQRASKSPTAVGLPTFRQGGSETQCLTGLPVSSKPIVRKVPPWLLGHSVEPDAGLHLAGCHLALLPAPNGRPAVAFLRCKMLAVIWATESSRLLFFPFFGSHACPVAYLFGRTRFLVLPGIWQKDLLDMKNACDAITACAFREHETVQSELPHIFPKGMLRRHGEVPPSSIQGTTKIPCFKTTLQETWIRSTRRLHSRSNS